MYSVVLCSPTLDPFGAILLDVAAGSELPAIRRRMRRTAILNDMAALEDLSSIASEGLAPRSPFS